MCQLSPSPSLFPLSSMVPLLQLISRGSPMSFEDSNRIIPLFYLFSSLFSHSLISVHDSEFFGHEIEGLELSTPFFGKCVVRLHISKQMVILTPYFLICYSRQNNVSSVVFSLILSPRHVIVKINISEKRVNQFCPSTGQSQSSMMPFTLSELVTLSRCLRDACLGIIKLAYPETKTEHREEYMAAFRSVGVKTNTEVQQHIRAEQKRWVQLFKVRRIKPPAHCKLNAVSCHKNNHGITLSYCQAIVQSLYRHQGTLKRKIAVPSACIHTYTHSEMWNFCDVRWLHQCLIKQADRGTSFCAKQKYI